MATTPITKSVLLDDNDYKKLHECDALLLYSYSMIDLTISKSTDNDTVEMEVILTNRDSGFLPEDYLIRTLTLTPDEPVKSVSKIILGPGNKLFIRRKSSNSAAVNVFVHGLDDTTSVVLSGGTNPATGDIKGGTTSNTSLTSIGYTHPLATAAIYTSAALYLNNNEDEDIDVSVAVGPNLPSPKSYEVTVHARDTAILKNIMLKPGDRVYISVTSGLIGYKLNGLAVKPPPPPS